MDGLLMMRSVEMDALLDAPAGRFCNTMYTVALEASRSDGISLAELHQADMRAHSAQDEFADPETFGRTSAAVAEEQAAMAAAAGLQGDR